MNGLFTQQILPWLWRKRSIVPTLLLAFFVSLPAQAVDDPDGVQFTLSACRLEDGNLQIGDIGGEDWFYCTNKANKSAYTTGNLGKLWSELDIVPHRLEVKTQAGDPDQTYRVVLAGDHLLDGSLPLADQIIGWDLMTTPLITDGNCKIVDMDPLMNEVVSGFVGGVDSTLVRWIDIEHPSNTTCVIDYGVRLSIRSSGFSGSSLQSQLLKQDYSSIGQRTLSLPVKDILPQEISKTMTATRDVANTWSLNKKASDEPLDFGETCEPDKPITAKVDITIEWTVTSAPGGTNIITTINAKNPSTRNIIVALEDELYDNDSASGTPFHTFMTDDATLPNGVEFVYDNGDLLGILVKRGYNGAIATFSKAFELELGDELSNRVTASYIDFQYPDVPIDGTEQATSSTLVGAGSSDNATAVISDFEQVSGNENLTFSVDEVVGEQGEFVDEFGDPIAYNLGTKVTELYWKSAEQSTNGSVVFKKTLYLAQPSILDNSKLYDKATLKSEEQKVDAEVSVTLKSDAKVKLDIIKEIDPAVLGEDESATFDFVVKHCEEGDGENVDTLCTSTTASVTLTGEYTGSTTVSGLDPFKTYEVMEKATEGFSNGSDNPQYVSIELPSCEGEVTFVNNPIKPKAKVKKFTLPAIEGYAGGWSFTLYKNGELFDTGTTDSNGDLTFSKELDEGNYEVKESVKDNWQLTSVIDPRADNENKVCEFTVDLPDDWDNVFTCTFTNTLDGRVLIRKKVEVESYLSPVGTFNFSGALGDFVIETDAFNTEVDSPDGYVYITPNTVDNPYLVTEDDPSSSNFSFTKVTCNDPSENSGQSETTPRTAEIVVEPGETVECTFYNLKEARPGKVVIKKITKGGTGKFDFDFGPQLDGESDFSLTTQAENVAVEEIIEPISAGLYKVEELDAFDSADGFDLVDLYCVDPNEQEAEGNTTSWNDVEWDGENPSANISVDDGETVTCTFVNRKRGKIIVDKVTNPSEHPQEFEFDPSYSEINFKLTDTADPHDSGWLVPGSYSVKEIVPDGWDLTQVMCRPDGGDESALLVPPVPNPNPVSVELNAGDVVRCTFTNVQRGMVDVVKTLAGEPLGDGDEFTFEIRLDDGTGSAIASATAAGPLGFGDAVDFSCTSESFYCMTVGGMAKLPIQKNGVAIQYAFCETGMDPGWKNIQLDEFGNEVVPQNWFVPGNPDGDPDLDNSVECIPFTLEPGDTTRFYIDDVPPPGGDARTIGYWKNWTSCDGRGNQDPVMDMNLPITLYQGFSIGDSVLGEDPDGQCAIAVDLLDKRHVGIEDEVRDSDKRANDAAYSLAAQYVAYLLNQNAGAYYCAKADSAAGEAAYLLMDIGFNGQGSYLPSGRKGSDLNLSPKHYKELQDLARKLAGILDSYNNNECQ